MKLTPKQREFLQIASQDGAQIEKLIPLGGRAPYWYAKTDERSHELRERWGNALRSTGLIEINPDHPRVGWRRHYRITDAGRKAVE